MVLKVQYILQDIKLGGSITRDEVSDERSDEVAGGFLVTSFCKIVRLEEGLTSPIAVDHCWACSMGISSC